MHRRFQQWYRNEVLRAAGASDESECLMEASLASAKGGPAEVVPTKRGKRVKIMAIVDGIEMMALHRPNCMRHKCLDGRRLHRYQRRWNVERLRVTAAVTTAPSRSSRIRPLMMEIVAGRRSVAD